MRSMAQSPGLLFLLVLAAGFFLLRCSGVEARRTKLIARIAAAVSVAAFLLILVLNLGRPGMLWHDEANILSVAAAWLHGQPIYHAVNAPVFYALFYGPATFLVYAAFFALFSHAIAAMKVAVLLLGALEIWLLWLLVRSVASRAASLALLTAAPLFLLAYPMQLLAFRGDLWLLVCATAAFVLAVRGRRLSPVLAGVLAGLAMGAAIDFKLTVAPLALVLFPLLDRTRGRRSALAAIAGCVAGGLAPFALPRVSLVNYLRWLEIAGHQRFLRSTCAANLLIAAAFVVLCVLPMVREQRAVMKRRAVWVLCVIGVMALAVLVVTGSKDGAGGWHLWPGLPMVWLAAAWGFGDGPDMVDERDVERRSSSRRASVVSAIAIAGAVVTLVFAVRDLKAVRPPHLAAWRAKQAEARDALREILQQPVEGRLFAMGEGSSVTDYRTDLRYMLPLAGEPYFFDENAVVEATKAGRAMPEAVVERMLGCGDAWIVPHGQTPFSATTEGILPASDGKYIFPAELRDGFVKTHVLVRQGSVYDLWACPAGRE